MKFRNKCGFVIFASCVTFSCVVLATENIITPKELLSHYDSQKPVKMTIQPENVSCEPYDIYVHAPHVGKLIRNRYANADIEEVIQATQPTRDIKVIKKKWGTFIEAASFADTKHADDTNYNAIWLRDSLWGYLALNTIPARQNDAKAVLLTLWDYLSSPDQLKRMENIIKNPSILNEQDGQMLAVHIRFNSNSPAFEDVMENHHPQPWTHKQNDALGLFIDTIITAIKKGQIHENDWSKGERLESLIKLTAYLQRIHFYGMADSGAWEEIPRINTSSIGLVTSGLENLFDLLYIDHDKENDIFRKQFHDTVKKFNYEWVVNKEKIETSINIGYTVIKDHLILGGESPAYDKSDIHYREADAALLNLIYPARLSRLTLEQKKQILNLVKDLEGPFGIKRYHNDNYQSANFWFHGIKTDTDSASHKKRRENYITGTEAQWFFDSWYGIAALHIFHETNDSVYYEMSIRHLNRALAQITGTHVLGADGKRVLSNAMPESYNLVQHDNLTKEFPSPITPLNWAKAALTILLETMQTDIIRFDPTHQKENVSTKSVDK